MSNFSTCLFERKKVNFSFIVNLLLCKKSLPANAWISNEISVNKYIFLFQDKLLTKLEKNEPELASSQEDEVSERFFSIVT